MSICQQKSAFGQSNRLRAGGTVSKPIRYRDRDRNSGWISIANFDNDTDSDPDKTHKYPKAITLVQKAFDQFSDRFDFTFYKDIDLPRGKEHILLVDDEPAIVKMTSQLLTYLGYRVTSRTDSADALALFEKNPHQFDLVVTDMTMPTIRGDVLAREIVKLRAHIPIILCTGYSKHLSPEKPRGIRAVLMKPIEQVELAGTVRKVLDEGTGMKK